MNLISRGHRHHLLVVIVLHIHILHIPSNIHLHWNYWLPKHLLQRIIRLINISTRLCTTQQGTKREDIVRCSHGRRIRRLCLKRKLVGSHGDWPKPSNLFRPVTSCTCTTGPPTQQRWETQSDLSKDRVIPNYRIRMYGLTRPQI